MTDRSTPRESDDMKPKPGECDCPLTAYGFMAQFPEGDEPLFTMQRYTLEAGTGRSLFRETILSDLTLTQAFRREV
jgi:hypothetical protein